VSDLREEIARLKEELEKQDYNWHQKTRTTQQALEQEYSQSLQKARDEARVEARKELSDEVRVLVRQKAQIEQELDEQIRAREQYLKEREKLRAETAETRRDAETRSEQLVEVQKQLHTTHRHNTELFLACKALKEKLESVIASRRQQQEQEAAGAGPPAGAAGDRKSRNLDGLLSLGEGKFVDEEEAGAGGGVSTREFELLRKELDDKDRRLREIRKIAKRLLSQRSMVETFLIDSLEACREEIFMEYQQRNVMERRERLAARNAHGGGAMTTPRGSLGGGGYQQQQHSGALSARGVPGHPQQQQRAGGLPPLAPGGPGSPPRPPMMPMIEDAGMHGGGGMGPAEGVGAGGGAFMTGVPEVPEHMGGEDGGTAWDGGPSSAMALQDQGLGGAEVEGGFSSMPMPVEVPLDLRRSVPLSKLSWRQREQILKMLFKKINEEGTTSTWKIKNKLRSL